MTGRRARSGDVHGMPSDVETFGDLLTWKLICGSSSAGEGWSKTTMAMDIPGVGCVLRVSSFANGNVAESLQFLPGAAVLERKNGEVKIVDVAELP